MIDEHNSLLKLENIKTIIYNENNQNELTLIVKAFDKGQDVEALNSVLMVVNDAWNYFPHKALGELSPAEKIQETDKRKLKFEEFNL